MLFSLNEFLMSVSFALDFVEMDVLGVTTNHGKRTAYIALKIARQFRFSDEELHDLAALALLHDNGISEKCLHDKFPHNDSLDVRSFERVMEHCTIGEENVSQYPLLTKVKDIIKYHHENFDGSGYFNLQGEEIPLMSQIIHMADVIETNFHLETNLNNVQIKVYHFVNDQRNKMFSPKVANAFINVSEENEFWENLHDDYIYKSLRKDTPQYSEELSFEEIRKVTGVFSKIIDSKSAYTQRHSSALSEKAGIMADYYKMDREEKMKLIIAADLHDIGKLAMPNTILDSPQKLTEEEFEIIKKHPYYTRLALQEIKGFEDIVEWAANHHEKLNGQGYPFEKTGKDLDFNSRLMSCLDVYEALTEERPYRRSLSHKEAMDIINKMKDNGFIDATITEDIDYVFAKLS